MDEYLNLAIEEARKSYNYYQSPTSNGTPGIPIGSALVIDGQLKAVGHNQRVQHGSPVLHAEMHCLENAGRLKASDYQRATLYTTLSPCSMCSGAILLYKIPRVVIGENENFRGPEEYLQQNGVDIQVVDSEECKEMLKNFINEHPEIWYEDIGEKGESF